MLSKLNFGILMLILVVVSPVFAQFEQGAMTFGFNGGYTRGLGELNNWFDEGTWQGAVSMTYGFSDKRAYELRVSYGKFTRSFDRDEVETRTVESHGNTYMGDGAIEWQYKFDHLLKTVTVYNNLLYRPWTSGAGRNVHVIAGLILTRWEFERDLFTFTGWDNEARKELKNLDMKKLNRNGYHAGINLGAGLVIPVGPNISLDVKLQYEAFLATLWPFLLIEMDQVLPVNYAGVHVGLRFRK